MKNHENPFEKRLKLRPEQLKAVYERSSIRAVAGSNVLSAAKRTFPDDKLSNELKNQLQSNISQDEKAVTDLLSHTPDVIIESDVQNTVPGTKAPENSTETQVVNVAELGRRPSADEQYATFEQNRQNTPTATAIGDDHQIKLAQEARARVEQAHNRQPSNVVRPQFGTPPPISDRRAA